MPHLEKYSRRFCGLASLRFTPALKRWFHRGRPDCSAGAVLGFSSTCRSRWSPELRSHRMYLERFKLL